MTPKLTDLNAVGRLTQRFLRSKITVLLMLAAALFGLMAILFTPRMYNPEISVPAANVVVRFPGATAPEVHNQVVRPLENLMAAMQGVDHTYGYAVDDLGVVTVQFKVGEDPQRSLVKVYDQISRNLDRIPHGVAQPLIQSTSINDVPVLTFTLSSAHLDRTMLRGLALRVTDSLRSISDVGDTKIYGASPGAVTAWIDPARLAAAGIALDRLEQTLAAYNVALPASHLVSGNRETAVRVSGELGDAAQVGAIVIGTHAGKPVFLRDVARVKEGPATPRQYGFIGYGPAATRAASPDGDRRHRQARRRQ
jgi:multidrug efflux pump subunit AcrB